MDSRTNNNYPLWQEAHDLTFDILSVKTGVNIDPNDSRQRVAHHYLRESHKILMAVYRLLSGESCKEMLSPAQVLLRSMEEYATRLEYLAAYPDKLEDFLQYSFREPPPSRPWKSVADMSEDEKVGLTEHYKEVYKFLSQKVHGDIRTEGPELFNLRYSREIPDHTLANTMAGGILYYTMVVNINVEVFPNLKDNFRIVSSGTDWNNRFEALSNALMEAAETYQEEANQFRQQLLEDMQQ